MKTTIKTGIKVLDAMTTKPVVCKPGTTLLDAAKLMKANGVGSVVVKDGDNKLIGIVTEKDFLTKAVVKQLPMATTPISEIMTKNVVKITPDKDIFDAIVMMKDGGFRRLAVVDDERSPKPKLMGMITVKDILRIEPAMLDLLFETLDIREASRKPIYQSSDADICSVCGNVSLNIVTKNNMRMCKICAKDR